MKTENGLKWVRRFTGKKNKQIAKEMGINHQRLNRLIAGINEPTFTEIILLLKANNIQVSIFINWCTHEFNK